MVISSNGRIAIAIHDGKYCAEKGFDEDEVIITEKIVEECMVTDDDDIVIEPENPDDPEEPEIPEVPKYQDKSGASMSELSDGMIPIKWDGEKWIKANISEEWYDYNKREWANVVLVKEAKRDTYKSAEPGTTITEADVLAYLVWIPRYRYKLFNVMANSGINTKEIEIIFEDNNTTKSTGSANNTWLTHPAFTFGTDELNGMWVGKFETTGNASTPTIKPGVSSLRSQNIKTQFATAQKLNNEATCGLTSTYDSHMMKNSEWGAVAYLSQSKYGKNTRIWVNPSKSYITGCAGTVATALGDNVEGCVYHYYTSNGQQASTTGNIYGIYDMSGGAWEYVMGV